MPLKNEERVGRKVGSKGSQLFRSDKGSIKYKDINLAKKSKMFKEKNEENEDSSSVDASESDKK